MIQTAKPLVLHFTHDHVDNNIIQIKIAFDEYNTKVVRVFFLNNFYAEQYVECI